MAVGEKENTATRKLPSKYASRVVAWREGVRERSEVDDKCLEIVCVLCLRVQVNHPLIRSFFYHPRYLDETLLSEKANFPGLGDGDDVGATASENQSSPHEASSISSSTPVVPLPAAAGHASGSSYDSFF